MTTRIDYSRDNITIESVENPIGKHQFICGRLVKITKAEEIGPGPFQTTIFCVIEAEIPPTKVLYN